MSLTKATFSMIEGAVANVLDYGATGDGSTDDTAAIQAAVNASKAVFFPKPSGAFYKCTSPITLRQGSCVQGADKQDTVVKFFGCDGFVADVAGAGVFDIQIRNLGIVGDTAGTTKHGIKLDGTANTFGRVDLENLVLGYFSGDGVYMIRPIVSQLRLVSSSFNGRHGFNIEGDGTSVYASSCYANTNGGDGWLISGRVQYSSFDACASDANVGCGYNFDGTAVIPAESITMSSCGAETNGSDQFRFGATLGLTLNSIFVYPGSPATGGHFINLDGARHVTLNGIRMTRTAPVGKYALNLGNLGGTQFPGDISLNGCLFSSTNATPDQIIDINAQPRFSRGSGTYSNLDIVTHNLGITPNNIFVNSDSATIQACARNFGPTTFEITIYDLSVSPPTPVTGQPVKWQASWQP